MRFMELDRQRAVKLLLDTGHATFGGADPVALAKKYRNRIAHVHCKDVRKDVLARHASEDWSFLDAVVEGCFTVPGDGMVELPGVLQGAARLFRLAGGRGRAGPRRPTR